MSPTCEELDYFWIAPPGWSYKTFTEAQHTQVIESYTYIRDVSRKKSGKMWEFFPSRKPHPSPLPSPRLGMSCFWGEKNYGLFCILGPLEHFWFSQICYFLGGIDGLVHWTHFQWHIKVISDMLENGNFCHFQIWPLEVSSMHQTIEGDSRDGWDELNSDWSYFPPFSHFGSTNLKKNYTGTLACSVLPQSWNFASKLGQPMWIGMIGPQTKIYRPINNRIPVIFVFNGIFNGEMALFWISCRKMTWIWSIWL